MENHISHIKIQNFKSIRELELTGFKKINLLIGRPNVGKSNFLEALGLFSLGYLFEGDYKNHYLTDIVRCQRLMELFYNFGKSDERHKGYIQLKQKSQSHKIPTISYGFDNQDASTHLRYYENPMTEIPDEIFILEENMKIRRGNESSSKSIKINYYKFNPHFKFHKFDTNFLLPPYGENLASVLAFNPKIAEEVSHWFEPFKLELDIDLSSFEVKLRKKLNGFAYLSFPYSSIADTLQRIIFYKTAIASNTHSVLVFEEPEAHAFPPYIAEFTQEVISSKTNQFFIATHSPLIVNDFLENARHDLAIFLADFKDEQTVMRSLTTEEIEEVYQYGVDLFFNNEAYLT
jgi:AAA15 family ATPase/GTPase